MYDKILFELASKLISPADHGEGCTDLLKTIGDVCSAERVAVFQFVDHGSAWEILYEWRRDASFQRPSADSYRIENFPWVEDLLKTEGLVTFGQGENLKDQMAGDLSRLIDDSPVNENTDFSAVVLHESLMLALLEGVHGSEGFLLVSDGSTRRPWSESERDFVHSGATILGRFLERQRLEQEHRHLYENLQSQLKKWHNAEEEKILLVTAVDQAVDMIIMTDAKGNILYVNPSFEVNTGYKHMDVFGMNLNFLEMKSNSAGSVTNMLDTILTGREWSGTLSLTRKDGSPCEVEASVSPIRNENGDITHFVSVQHDVSREIELRRQLEAAKKLESIGALAGGIAHDFNNLLTPIIGYTELTMDYVKDYPLAVHNLKRILRTANRAKALVKQILTFSLQGAQPISPIYVQPVIREALRMLKVSMPKTVDVQLKIDEECGMVCGEATQIHQVIMNLLTNAIDAMEGLKGVLTISLSECFLAEDDMVFLKINLPPNKYVRISVRDTGKGMDVATRERIFEPYFTTKEPGKGTGMGLSVLYGIVIGYGGDIRVDSEPGKGSEFSIYLPGIDGHRRPESVDGTGNKARIMYVDDDKAIAEFGRDMLEGLGYYATMETGGESALEAFKADPGSFDIIITDLVMPDMGGDILAGMIHRIREDIPIIACTGFGESISQTEEARMNFHNHIMKPVTVETLSETIKKVLLETESQRGQAGK